MEDITPLTPLDKKTIYKLLDRSYPVDKLPYDTMVMVGSLIVESREQHQRILGRLASTIALYKRGGMAQFALDIEGSTGRKVSVQTLRQYREVYEALRDYPIPADLTYSALRELARQRDIEGWLTRLKKEGWTDAQFIRQMRLEAGELPQKRLFKCPFCHHETEIA